VQEAKRKSLLPVVERGLLGLVAKDRSGKANDLHWCTITNLTFFLCPARWRENVGFVMVFLSVDEAYLFSDSRNGMESSRQG